MGGLDRYDSGDLIINNISTKKYKDRDWDSYRNYRVGFIFQSYNLIMHQTILSNVEIGEGAIVAAGAIVIHSVPPFYLAIGTPARIKPLPDHLKVPNRF